MSTNAATITTTVIEFIGPPGAGKTEISRALSNLLRASGRAVDEPSYNLSRLPGRPGIRELRHAFLPSMVAPVLTMRLALLVARSRPTGARRAVTLLLDILYGIALVRRQRRHAEIGVFDQAALQALVTLASEAKALPDISDIRTFISRTSGAELRRIVVAVRAPLSVVARRLAERQGAQSRVERIAEPESRAALLRRTHIATNRLCDALRQQDDGSDRGVTLIEVTNDRDQGLEDITAALYDRLSDILPPSNIKP